MKLEGKRALVTGGSRGMGLAIARKLLQEGAEVLVWDKDPGSGEFPHTQVDLRDREALSQAMDSLVALDILVNNAGVYFEQYLEDTTDEELDRMVDVNIKGTYMVTRGCMGLIRKSRGCIVTVASCLGMVPEPTSPLYCATKAGLVMLTKCLAQQYSCEGVRVNCVLPGPIDTQLLQDSFVSPGMEERCAARIPLRRIGQPEEVANVVAFLAGPEASYVTGGVYAVDGGVASSSLYSR